MNICKCSYGLINQAMEKLLIPWTKAIKGNRAWYLDSLLVHNFGGGFAQTSEIKVLIVWHCFFSFKTVLQNISFSTLLRDWFHSCAILDALGGSVMCIVIDQVWCIGRWIYTYTLLKNATSFGFGKEGKFGNCVEVRWTCISKLWSFHFVIV